MFFVIIVLWIAAWALTGILRKVNQGALLTTCPFFAIGGFIAAGVLYLTDQVALGLIVLLASFYLSGTILWSLLLQVNSPGRT
jgi:hypothetical protein